MCLKAAPPAAGPLRLTADIVTDDRLTADMDDLLCRLIADMDDLLII